MRDNTIPIQSPFRDINKFTLRFRNAMTKNAEFVRGNHPDLSEASKFSNFSEDLTNNISKLRENANFEKKSFLNKRNNR